MAHPSDTQPRLNGRFSHRPHAEGEGLDAMPSAAMSAEIEDYLLDHPEIGQVADALREHDADCYLVGGLVRDLSLRAHGQFDGEPKDIDITSPLPPEQFREAVADLDASVFDVGEAHGTTGLAFERPDGTRVVIEHTTHRSEIYEDETRQPTVSFGTSLEDDLARRDFTFNAMAVDATTGEIIDPFDGATDLECGVIRTPLDPTVTMDEDPLRAFRAVRFAALRGYVASPEVAEAIYLTRDRFAAVSVERRRDELDRVFSAGSSQTAYAIEAARRMGVEGEMLDGLGRDLDTERLRDYDLNREETLALLHLTSPESTLGRFKFTNADQARAAKIAHVANDCLSDSGPMLRYQMRRFGADTFVAASQVDEAWGNHRSSFEHARIRREINEASQDIARPVPVDGRDVMALDPKFRGPVVGAALEAATWEMCENPKATRDEVLAAARSAAERAAAATGRPATHV